MAALSLEGGEEEGWQDDLGGEESEDVDDLCVVSNFLTASVIQFQTMKSTLANLWHPYGGKGEDPMEVPLVFTNFWVQIHDLPSGLMSKDMARQFRNFIGKFWSMIQKLWVGAIGKIVTFRVGSIDYDSIQNGNGRVSRREVSIGKKDVQGFFQNKTLLNYTGINLGLNWGGRKLSDFEDEENVDPNLGPVEEDSLMEIGRPDAMKPLSWNVQGLRNLQAVWRLWHVLKELNPSVDFFIETNLQNVRMEKVCRSWGFSCGIDVTT
ncbi:hypothetical protein Goklo_005963 [Gossypium klotzschianum]|uniref:DUF4283 domain-containing protein n=1 Tax=Gossypium klotzschianum TaxID=34286 RepID=A0A7J8VGW4_9ROSI|nr:hypothetical protein [Gossypium klotzschianum]